jgi:hypothetical protein
MSFNIRGLPNVLRLPLMAIVIANT